MSYDSGVNTSVQRYGFRMQVRKYSQEGPRHCLLHRIIRWEVQQHVAAGEAASKEVAADAHEEVYQLGHLTWDSDRR